MWTVLIGESIKVKKSPFMCLAPFLMNLNIRVILSSCEKMLNNHDEFCYLKDYINRDLDPEWGIYIDDKIIDDFDKVHWLHLSNCMNNGGSSQLYIDFLPSDTGKVGQVVMYLHDPDELAVIAESFDGYLQLLIDSEFASIEEDMADEFYWD